MSSDRIPWTAAEFTPELTAGISPDGFNEYTYPDYPDFPYPDTLNDLTWYRDPLVNNDEPSPTVNAWDLDDPENPWRLPYGPEYPPAGW